MPMIYDALTMILQVLWFIMIAHIVMSWLINFQVLNLRQPLVAQIWYGLNQMLEPIYRPIRRILPNTGGFGSRAAGGVHHHHRVAAPA